jgi:hypothetical protein
MFVIFGLVDQEFPMAAPDVALQGPPLLWLVPADERATRPTTVTDVETQQIRRKPVLNGLINEYVPAA